MERAIGQAGGRIAGAGDLGNLSEYAIRGITAQNTIVGCRGGSCDNRPAQVNPAISHRRRRNWSPRHRRCGSLIFEGPRSITGHRAPIRRIRPGTSLDRKLVAACAHKSEGEIPIVCGPWSWLPVAIAFGAPITFSDDGALKARRQFQRRGQREKAVSALQHPILPPGRARIVW